MFQSFSNVFIQFKFWDWVKKDIFLKKKDIRQRHLSSDKRQRHFFI